MKTGRTYGETIGRFDELPEQTFCVEEWRVGAVLNF